MIKDIILYAVYFAILCVCVIIVWLIVNRCVGIYVNSRFFNKNTNLLIILTLFVLCIVNVLFYIKHDRVAFYYGDDCTFCNKKLPFEINPYYVSEYPQRFILIDEISKDGYSVKVGSGTRYYGSSFKIKDFLSYGYNDTSIIVKCTDSLNNIKYLSSYVTEYKNNDGSLVIGFQDLSDTCFQKINHNYKWYNVDNKTIENIIDKKNKMELLSILFVILFFVSLTELLRQGRRKNKQYF